jgi:alpha-tubulin suppressor-like RCC1 family protein
MVPLLALAGMLCVVFFRPPGRAKGRMARVALGPSYIVVVKPDGSLWTMGRNRPVSWPDVITQLGAVGNGTGRATPNLVRLGKDTDWADVAAGGRGFALALKADGSLWAWGEAKLGDGTQLNASLPVKIGEDTNWVAIAAQREVSYGIKRNGTLWDLGVARHGTRDWLDSLGGPPKPCMEDGWWKLLVEGSVGALARRGDGTLWRSVESAQSIGRYYWVQLDKEDSKGWWIGVAGGMTNVLGLTADGSLWTWRWVPGGRPEGPMQMIGTAHEWRGVGAGGWHVVAVKSDGTLWAWGDNRYGQVGDGTTYSASAPVRIGAAHDWAWAGASLSYSAAVKTDGSLWMWGQRIAGEGKTVVWLRTMVARYNIPIKLPPPRTMDLRPVKVADLGGWGGKRDVERQS